MLCAHLGHFDEGSGCVVQSQIAVTVDERDAERRRHLRAKESIVRQMHLGCCGKLMWEVDVGSQGDSQMVLVRRLYVYMMSQSQRSPLFVRHSYFLTHLPALSVTRRAP